jgi:transcriptional regulator with XRE-family HTH domain
MSSTPTPHQPCTAEDFTPAVPATTIICRACSYSSDGLALNPIRYPCAPANKTIKAAARLSAAVVARRIELGLTQHRLAVVCRISQRTIASVEEGHPADWRPTTRRALEYGLRWRSGSVTAILKGRKPTPLLATPKGIPPEEQVILQSGLPSPIEEALIAHMWSRRQDMTAALEVEARLLVDQMRAVMPPRNPHDAGQFG